VGGAEKSQQCQKYFFNTVHLLPKDPRFDNGGMPSNLVRPLLTFEAVNNVSKIGYD